MFDFGQNLDDPRNMGLLYAAAALMQGGPGKANFAQDLSRGLFAGLQGYGQGKAMQSKLGEEQQQRQMRDMTMEQMRRQQADDAAIRSAYQRNIVPGQPQMQPTDYETPSGPNGPSSMNLHGLQGDLMALGPQGFAAYAPIAAMQAKNIQKVGAGESLVDMSTNKPIFTAPDKPPTGMVRGPDGWVADPAYLDMQERIRRAGKPETNVNLPPADKAILKADSDRLDELSTGASQWRRIAQTSTVINGLLKGKGGGQIVKVGAETAKFLNLPSETASANDLAQSLNTQLATQIRAPGSGATSNLEFEAYKSAAPSLSNTEDGRELMTQAAKKFAERNAKLADKARELIRAGKYSDSALAEYDDSLGSVLGEQLKKKMLVSAPVRGWGPLEVK